MPAALMPQALQTRFGSLTLLLLQLTRLLQIKMRTLPQYILVAPVVHQVSLGSPQFILVALMVP
jgi:hypothetical protein